MTVESEVVFDDRIGRWRVDLYKYDGTDWMLDREVGTFSTKKRARSAAEEAARGGSVYLEQRDGSLDRRYPA